MPKPAGGRERLKDRKHREILEAALVVFEEHGFRAATMDQVAAVAGASKRTVYNHFESKDGLFHALLGSLVGKLESEAPGAFDAERPFRPQIVELGRAHARAVGSGPFHRMARVLIEALIQDADTGEQFEAIREQSKAGLARWFEAAAAAGAMQMDDGLTAARQFAALIEAFCMWPQVLRAEGALSARKCNQVVDEAVTMFLSHYARG